MGELELDDHFLDVELPAALQRGREKTEKLKKEGKLPPQGKRRKLNFHKNPLGPLAQNDEDY